MPKLPLVLLHGYSDKGTSLAVWRDRLADRGWDPVDIYMTQYISLSNEVTIKDIAEGFDRALRDRLGTEQHFDAIVHSTGMLVIREWLTTYAARLRRLEHLIGLAPATFGSPLAHKGRGWLGGVFKGEKDVLNPDFMEAGDRVLSALELGSIYTWELAHKDLVGQTPIYGPDTNTPYPFVFVGLDDYGNFKTLLTQPGNGDDGTVRWAGVGLNCRKIELDLTRDPAREDKPIVSVWPRQPFDMPLTLVAGLNHGSILRAPTDSLVGMVGEALEVASAADYQAWKDRYADISDASRTEKGDVHEWQQFVIRAVDERGDPISDWYLELGEVRDNEFDHFPCFELDVHAFTDDPSLRCFHVDLTRLQPEDRRLQARVIAPSGTKLIAYHGRDSDHVDEHGEPLPGEAKWDAKFDITALPGISFFYPYTTTLVEMRLNREPLPFKEPNQVFWFLLE